MKKALKRKIAIGLDINPQMIYVAVVKKAVKGLVIARLASLPTPLGAIEDGVIIQPKVLGQSVRKLLAREGISTKDVIMGCRGADVVLHLSRFAHMSDRALKEAVKTQISKFVVFAGFETISDYQVADQPSEAGVKQAVVLIAAAKKSLVDSYVQMTQEARLNLVGIDDNSLAAQRALFEGSIKTASGQAVVTVIVDAGSTVINIYKDNRLFYTHTLDQGLSNDQEMKPFLAKLIQELDNVIQYYHSKFGSQAEVEKIVLAGEVQSISRLRRSPDEKLSINGISMDIADPLDFIPKDEKVGGFQRQDHNQYLARVIGLSMKGLGLGEFPLNLDLCPVEAIRFNEMKKRLKRIAFFSVFLVMALSLFFVSLRLRINTLKKEIITLQSQVDDLPAQYADLIDLERKSQKNVEEMRLQEQFFEEVHQRSLDDVLEEIQAIIPKDARLLSLNITADYSMNLAGEALSQEAAFNFERTLKESPYFENVKLGVIQDKQENQEFAYYTITGKLKTQEKAVRKP
ncbi:MAG: pilus assembly protein PilM [Candidatus Omnitrophota bacterium]